MDDQQQPMDQQPTDQQPSQQPADLQPPPNDPGAGLLQKPASDDPWENDGWKDLLRPDFKDADGNVDVKALAKAYKGAEKRIGSGDIPPKDESGYKIDVQFPEGVKIDEDRHKGFLKGAHAKGMTNGQVNWVMEQYSGLIAEAQQMAQAQKVNASEVLKKEWGDNFDTNLAAAQKAFHAVATQADIDAIEVIGNSVPVLRMLAKLGANLKEDPGLPTDVVGMGEEDIQAIQKSDAYWNPKHPDHTKAVRQVTQWHQIKARKPAA